MVTFPGLGGWCPPEGRPGRQAPPLGAPVGGWPPVWPLRVEFRVERTIDPRSSRRLMLHGRVHGSGSAIYAAMALAQHVGDVSLARGPVAPSLV